MAACSMLLLAQHLVSMLLLAQHLVSMLLLAEHFVLDARAQAALVAHVRLRAPADILILGVGRVLLCLCSLARTPILTLKIRCQGRKNEKKMKEEEEEGIKVRLSNEDTAG
jgi:hypothetical protein